MDQYECICFEHHIFFFFSFFFLFSYIYIYIYIHIYLYRVTNNNIIIIITLLFYFLALFGGKKDEKFFPQRLLETCSYHYHLQYLLYLPHDCGDLGLESLSLRPTQKKFLDKHSIFLFSFIFLV